MYPYSILVDAVKKDTAKIPVATACVPGRVTTYGGEDEVVSHSVILYPGASLGTSPCRCARPKLGLPH